MNKFKPESMAHNIGKFPRTRVGYKPDTMTRVKMKVGSAKRHMSNRANHFIQATLG